MTLHHSPVIIFSGKQISVLYRMIESAVAYAGTAPVFDTPTARTIRRELRNARNEQIAQLQRNERTDTRPDEEKYLTTTDVAELLGTGRRAVQQRARKLGGRKCRGEWIFDPDTIYDLMEEQ